MVGVESGDSAPDRCAAVPGARSAVMAAETQVPSRHRAVAPSGSRPSGNVPGNDGLAVAVAVGLLGNEVGFVGLEWP